jgi:hypothetical protein
MQDLMLKLVAPSGEPKIIKETVATALVDGCNVQGIDIYLYKFTHIVLIRLSNIVIYAAGSSLLIGMM